MDAPDEAMALAVELDHFFETAARERFASDGEHAELMFSMFFQHDPFKAVEFVEAFRRGGIYPEDRLTEVLERFAEVRLQMEYLHFDAGIANECYYAPITANPDLANSPRLAIRLMAIDQSIISRSRIAWEKLMRSVHYLETGGDLQRSNSKSYKAKFFSWVAGEPKWLFLEPYQSVVTDHDNRFRNGEFHKKSVLRPRIVGRETPTGNDFMTLSNYMRNCIWPNILEIVAGGQATHFTDLHASEGAEFGIDSRYLQELTGAEESEGEPTWRRVNEDSQE